MTAPPGNMHNLTTLIKRLEAATSRLEDMASSVVDSSSKANGGSPTPSIAPAPSAIVAPATPASIPAPPPAPPAETLPELVADFDTFLKTAVNNFVTLSKEIGGPVAKQAEAVLEGFKGQREFLLLTTKTKKPDYTSATFGKLLKPLQDAITVVVDIRDGNRGSPYFNQLSAVSESVSVFAWVTVDPKPVKHIEESLGASQYFGNRVLKDNKDTDQKQVAWIKSYYDVFKDLSVYVKDTFPQGILWNPKGVAVEEALKAAAAAPKALSGGPPPPPPPPPGPPPPPIKFDEAPKPAPSPAAGGLGAVFDELNKGEAVTKGLRKVNADQMTHKNPSLRAGATVPTRSDSQSSTSTLSRTKSPAPGKKPKPESMRTKKPPVKKLDGNKWYIENYDNESEPITIEAEISHSILISRCNKTTIIVKGKANAISIDNSVRLSLIIESLVSAIDVIKASNFALQVLGSLPTILMDQVDGAQVYLGKESMKTEVFTSKTTSINLLVIDEGDDEEDYKEVALPEQIRTYIDDEGSVVSEIVEHAG